MNKRSPVRFILAMLLSCTLMALASPQASADDDEARLSANKLQPLAENDPLSKWFKEQDKILDEILVRLSRIENLVREIHRLIMQMPAVGTAAPIQPTAAAPSVAPPTAPVVPATAETPKVEPQPVSTPKPAESARPSSPTATVEDGQLLLTLMLGGAAIVVLLLLWWNKRSNVSSKATAATVTFASEPAAAGDQPDTLDLEVGAIPEEEPVLHEKQVVQVTPAPKPPPQQTVAPPPAPVVSPPAPAAQMHDAGTAQDQAMELAEIMLSMGLGHGAAQTLLEQIRQEPKNALRQWLKLLEIYRKNGQQKEFEHSAEELRLHFNVQPEDWQAGPETQRGIEDYPHIAAKIVELWGKPACMSYLRELLDDNRGGARAGFPQSVAEELLLLGGILSATGVAPEADAVIDLSEHQFP